MEQNWFSGSHARVLIYRDIGSCVDSFRDHPSGAAVYLRKPIPLPMGERHFPKTSRNTVVRIPKRGHYDKETIYGILDDHFLCHLSTVHEGQPVTIPTAYGRDGDTLYVHGSSKSRMLQWLADGRPLCLVVTQVDGLVVARSLFHSSVNYRSVVIYGHARLADGEEKMHGLRCITEQIIAGRWEEARLPTALEMKATSVLAVTIDTASAKVRSGPPGDDTEDYTLPIWAGVLPVRQVYDDPVPDPLLSVSANIPESVRRKRSIPDS